MAITARSKKGKVVSTLDNAERDRDAAQLRGLGLGFAEIAERMGYADASGAFRAVRRALAATRAEGTAEARLLELERLDLWLQRANQVFERPGPQVDRMGHPVIDPATGEPYPNRDVQLGAIDRAARLMERRARLLGLDAPKPSLSLIADVSLADLEARIVQLRAELAASGVDVQDLDGTSRHALPGTVEPADPAA